VFSVRNSFTGVAATMLKRTGLLKERKLPTSNSISIAISFEKTSQKVVAYVGSNQLYIMFL
jgi:hypothetical protein